MEEIKKRRSPIEVLIDQACAQASVDGRRRRPSETETELAERVAGSALFHIDQMYPAMWTGVAKTARRSLRNTIIAEVEGALIEAAESDGN